MKTLAVVVALLGILPDGGALDAGVKLDAGYVAYPVVFPTKQLDGGTLLACREKQLLCFSPEGDCDAAVVDFIDRQTRTLDVIIYSVNRARIVDALARAQARGVKVRVIVDSSQIQDPKEQPALQRLLALGVPMKRDTHSGIMHMKVAVGDSHEFLTGSFNWTNNASDNNDENLLVWDCQRIALAYQTKFDALWARFKVADDMVLKGLDAGVPDAGK